MFYLIDWFTEDIGKSLKPYKSLPDFQSYLSINSSILVVLIWNRMERKFEIKQSLPSYFNFFLVKEYIRFYTLSISPRGNWQGCTRYPCQFNSHSPYFYRLRIDLIFYRLRIDLINKTLCSIKSDYYKLTIVCSCTVLLRWCIGKVRSLCVYLNILC